MAQQIAAVWRDLDIQDRIRWKKVGDGRANFCIGRQNQQPGRIFADTKLDRAAKHSFRLDAAQFALSNLRTVWQFRAWKRERNFIANFVICCATNNLALGAAAIVYFTDCEPIGIRMTRRRGDLRNDHLVDVRAARFDVFGFDPSASQQFGNVFRIFWKIDELAQPVNGKLHFFAESFRAKSKESRGIA